MQLTKFTHSCVRFDDADRSLVIDPGVFSEVDEALDGAGAVLITHEHPDHISEPSWKALVGRLRAASPEFAELWARHDVRGIENKRKRYRTELVGMLHLEATNAWLAPKNGTRLLAYTPGDAETGRRLEKMARLIEEGH